MVYLQGYGEKAALLINHIIMHFKGLVKRDIARYHFFMVFHFFVLIYKIIHSKISYLARCDSK